MILWTSDVEHSPIVSSFRLPHVDSGLLNLPFPQQTNWDFRVLLRAQLELWRLPEFELLLASLHRLSRGLVFPALHNNLPPTPHPPNSQVHVQRRDVVFFLGETGFVDVDWML